MTRPDMTANSIANRFGDIQHDYAGVAALLPDRTPASPPRHRSSAKPVRRRVPRLCVFIDAVIPIYHSGTGSKFTKAVYHGDAINICCQRKVWIDIVGGLRFLKYGQRTSSGSCWTAMMSCGNGGFLAISLSQMNRWWINSSKR